VGNAHPTGCHIVGDFTTEAGSNNLYAPKVIMVAAVMSQMILRRCLEGGR
jgi:hypothetical protein